MSARRAHTGVRIAASPQLGTPESAAPHSNRVLNDSQPVVGLPLCLWPGAPLFA